MTKKLLSSKLVLLLLFCSVSFLAGAINGFVGTGGGIIFVFMLSKLTELDKKDIFATSLVSTALISSVTLLNYVKAGSIHWETVIRCAAPALLGGTLGAFLVTKLRVEWLNLIFSALLIYSGVHLIIRL